MLAAAPPPVAGAAALFGAAGTAALLGWVALALTLAAPPVRRWGWRVTGVALPGVLAVAYVAALATAIRGGAVGGFGSIAEVRALFANDWALTGGWVHYLAFDLMVGTWIARTGVEAGVPRLLLVPCLVLTFLAGPAGLLLYLVLRAPGALRRAGSGRAGSGRAVAPREAVA